MTKLRTDLWKSMSTGLITTIEALHLEPRSVGLPDDQTTNIPMKINVKFWRGDGSPLLYATMYGRLLDGLIYLTVTTPVIAYVVQAVSQFDGWPHKHHFTYWWNKRDRPHTHHPIQHKKILCRFYIWLLQAFFFLDSGPSKENFFWSHHCSRYTLLHLRDCR